MRRSHGVPIALSVPQAEGVAPSATGVEEGALAGAVAGMAAGAAVGSSEGAAAAAKAAAAAALQGLSLSTN